MFNLIYVKHARIVNEREEEKNDKWQKNEELDMKLWSNDSNRSEKFKLVIPLLQTTKL